MRCATDRPLPYAAALPIYLIISRETREMPRAFVPFYLLRPVVRVCFSPRFTTRVGCYPMETSVTHYPRNAREKLLRSFSPPPSSQRFEKLRVLSEFYSWIYIYIYRKRTEWKDAVKYREPDENIGYFWIENLNIDLRFFFDCSTRKLISLKYFGNAEK